MIEEPPVLVLHENTPRPSTQQIAALTDIQTGFIADALGGGGALDSCIRNASAGVLSDRLVGTALTCRCAPADLLPVLGSLSLVQPGDVLVISTGGWRGCAVIGDRVLGMLKNAGGIGLVTDGLVRDKIGIEEVGMPVYCQGFSPNSPFTHGPGEVGCEIVMGDVAINSGDIVVADETGVVVVPLAKVDEVIQSLQHIVMLEAELDKEVANGLVVPEAIVELLASDKVRRV